MAHLTLKQIPSAPSAAMKLSTLQYYKLHRQTGESGKELIRRLRIAKAEVDYEEIGDYKSLNDNDKLIEIVFEITVIEDTSVVSSK